MTLSCQVLFLKDFCLFLFWFWLNFLHLLKKAHLALSIDERSKDYGDVSVLITDSNLSWSYLNQPLPVRIMLKASLTWSRLQTKFSILLFNRNIFQELLIFLFWTSLMFFVHSTKKVVHGLDVSLITRFEIIPKHLILLFKTYIFTYL